MQQIDKKRKTLLPSMQTNNSGNNIKISKESLQKSNYNGNKRKDQLNTKQRSTEIYKEKNKKMINKLLNENCTCTSYFNMHKESTVMKTVTAQKALTSASIYNTKRARKGIKGVSEIEENVHDAEQSTKNIGKNLRNLLQNSKPEQRSKKKKTNKEASYNSDDCFITEMKSANDTGSNTSLSTNNIEVKNIQNKSSRTKDQKIPKHVITKYDYIYTQSAGLRAGNIVVMESKNHRNSIHLPTYDSGVVICHSFDNDNNKKLFKETFCKTNEFIKDTRALSYNADIIKHNSTHIEKIGNKNSSTDFHKACNIKPIDYSVTDSNKTIADITTENYALHKEDAVDIRSEDSLNETEKKRKNKQWTHLPYAYETCDQPKVMNMCIFSNDQNVVTTNDLEVDDFSDSSGSYGIADYFDIPNSFDATHVSGTTDISTYNYICNNMYDKSDDKSDDGIKNVSQSKVFKTSGGDSATSRDACEQVEMQRTRAQTQQLKQANNKEAHKKNAIKQMERSHAFSYHFKNEKEVCKTEIDENIETSAYEINSDKLKKNETDEHVANAICLNNMQQPNLIINMDNGHDGLKNEIVINEQDSIYNNLFMQQKEYKESINIYNNQNNNYNSHDTLYYYNKEYKLSHGLYMNCVDDHNLEIKKKAKESNHEQTFLYNDCNSFLENENETLLNYYYKIYEKYTENDKENVKKETEEITTKDKLQINGRKRNGEPFSFLRRKKTKSIDQNVPLLQFENLNNKDNSNDSENDGNTNNNFLSIFNENYDINNITDILYNLQREMPLSRSNSVAQQNQAAVNFVNDENMFSYNQKKGVNTNVNDILEMEISKSDNFYESSYDINRKEMELSNPNPDIISSKRKKVSGHNMKRVENHSYSLRKKTKEKKNYELNNEPKMEKFERQIIFKENNICIESVKVSGSGEKKNNEKFEEKKNRRYKRKRKNKKIEKNGENNENIHNISSEEKPNENEDLQKEKDSEKKKKAEKEVMQKHKCAYKTRSRTLSHSHQKSINGCNSFNDLYNSNKSEEVDNFTNTINHCDNAKKTFSACNKLPSKKIKKIIDTNAKKKNNKNEKGKVHKDYNEITKNNKTYFDQTHNINIFKTGMATRSKTSMNSYKHVYGQIKGNNNMNEKKNRESKMDMQLNKRTNLRGNAKSAIRNTISAEKREKCGKEKKDQNVQNYVNTSTNDKEDQYKRITRSTSKKNNMQNILLSTLQKDANSFNTQGEYKRNNDMGIITQRRKSVMFKDNLCKQIKEQNIKAIQGHNIEPENDQIATRTRRKIATQMKENISTNTEKNTKLIRETKIVTRTRGKVAALSASEKPSFEKVIAPTKDKKALVHPIEKDSIENVIIEKASAENEIKEQKEETIDKKENHEKKEEAEKKLLSAMDCYREYSYVSNIRVEDLRNEKLPFIYYDPLTRNLVVFYIEEGTGRIKNKNFSAQRFGHATAKKVALNFLSTIGVDVSYMQNNTIFYDRDSKNKPHNGEHNNTNKKGNTTSNRYNSMRTSATTNLSSWTDKNGINKTMETDENYNIVFNYDRSDRNVIISWYNKYSGFNFKKFSTQRFGYEVASCLAIDFYHSLGGTRTAENLKDYMVSTTTRLKRTTMASSAAFKNLKSENQLKKNKSEKKNTPRGSITTTNTGNTIATHNSNYDSSIHNNNNNTDNNINQNNNGNNNKESAETPKDWNIHMELNFSNKDTEENHNQYFSNETSNEIKNVGILNQMEQNNINQFNNNENHAYNNNVYNKIGITEKGEVHYNGTDAKTEAIGDDLKKCITKYCNFFSVKSIIMNIAKDLRKHNFCKYINLFYPLDNFSKFFDEKLKHFKNVFPIIQIKMLKIYQCDFFLNRTFYFLYLIYLDKSKKLFYLDYEKNFLKIYEIFKKEKFPLNKKIQEKVAKNNIFKNSCDYFKYIDKYCEDTVCSETFNKKNFNYFTSKMEFYRDNDVLLKGYYTSDDSKLYECVFLKKENKRSSLDVSSFRNRRRRNINNNYNGIGETGNKNNKNYNGYNHDQNNGKNNNNDNCNDNDTTTTNNTTTTTTTTTTTNNNNNNNNTNYNDNKEKDNESLKINKFSEINEQNNSQQFSFFHNYHNRVSISTRHQKHISPEKRENINEKKKKKWDCCLNCGTCLIGKQGNGRRGPKRNTRGNRKKFTAVNEKNNDTNYNVNNCCLLCFARNKISGGMTLQIETSSENKNRKEEKKTEEKMNTQILSLERKHIPEMENTKKETEHPECNKKVDNENKIKYNVIENANGKEDENKDEKKEIEEKVVEGEKKNETDGDIEEVKKKEREEQKKKETGIILKEEKNTLIFHNDNDNTFEELSKNGTKYVVCYNDSGILQVKVFNVKTYENKGIHEIIDADESARIEAERYLEYIEKVLKAEGIILYFDNKNKLEKDVNYDQMQKKLHNGIDTKGKNELRKKQKMKQNIPIYNKKNQEKTVVCLNNTNIEEMEKYVNQIGLKKNNWEKHPTNEPITDNKLVYMTRNSLKKNSEIYVNNEECIHEDFCGLIENNKHGFLNKKSDRNDDIKNSKNEISALDISKRESKMDKNKTHEYSFSEISDCVNLRRSTRLQHVKKNNEFEGMNASCECNKTHYVNYANMRVINLKSEEKICNNKKTSILNEINEFLIEGKYKEARVDTSIDKEHSSNIYSSKKKLNTEENKESKERIHHSDLKNSANCIENSDIEQNSAYQSSITNIFYGTEKKCNDEDTSYYGDCTNASLFISTHDSPSERFYQQVNDQHYNKKLLLEAKKESKYASTEESSYFIEDLCQMILKNTNYADFINFGKINKKEKEQKGENDLEQNAIDKKIEEKRNNFNDNKNQEEIYHSSDEDDETHRTITKSIDSLGKLPKNKYFKVYNTKNDYSGLVKYKTADGVFKIPKKSVYKLARKKGYARLTCVIYGEKIKFSSFFLTKEKEKGKDKMEKGIYEKCDDNRWISKTTRKAIVKRNNYLNVNDENGITAKKEDNNCTKYFLRNKKKCVL